MAKMTDGGGVRFSEAEGDGSAKLNLERPWKKRDISEASWRL